MTAPRAVVVFVLACSLLAMPAAAGTNSTDAGADTATLTAAFPDPVARGDPGEFVAVRVEEPTNATGWTLTDGTTTARLPNRTFDGEYAFSTTPEHAANHTDLPVVELDGRLQLADDGDRIQLDDGDATIDRARYRRAPTSELRDFESEAWIPIGATAYEPRRTDGGRATAFVLPDASDRTVETLRTADERLYLAGYTLSSERVRDALVAAYERGVDVRVLLDGAPVGGMSERQARILGELHDAGVEVRLLAGPHVRYSHHHPKYAVVDDRLLVTTENFKPAGTGGMSSRGWGVVLDDSEAVETVTDLYHTDADWRAATPWPTYRDGRQFRSGEPALGEFEERHSPEEVAVDSTTVLVAPDNAGEALEGRLETASDRVLIQQVTIGSRDNRLLRAAITAAERGTTVRIQLSDAWYVAEDNAELVAWLNRRAESEGWDLRAQVDDPDGYGKIHTKGVVVDDEVVVGSLNWRTASIRENREVAVVLEGEAPAAYYAEVFEDDWSDDERRSVPVGIPIVAVTAVAAALLVGRRIDYGETGERIDGWRS